MSEAKKEDQSCRPTYAVVKWYYPCGGDVLHPVKPAAGASPNRYRPPGLSR